jgi:hypothetical protein
LNVFNYVTPHTSNTLNLRKDSGVSNTLVFKPHIPGVQSREFFAFTHLAEKVTSPGHYEAEVHDVIS